MNQLEYIEALAAEAERFREDNQAHAYTVSADIARPLQNAVDALRHDIWELFILETTGMHAAQILKRSEEKAREKGDDADQKYNNEHALRCATQAETYGRAARILHRSLERAGLC
jgi:hypothetical protein